MLLAILASVFLDSIDDGKLNVRNARREELTKVNEGNLEDHTWKGTIVKA